MRRKTGELARKRYVSPELKAQSKLTIAQMERFKECWKAHGNDKRVYTKDA